MPDEIANLPDGYMKAGQQLMQDIAEFPCDEHGNPSHHRCHDCGYVWQHGAHGGHDCKGNIKAHRDKLGGALKIANDTSKRRKELCLKVADERNKLRALLDAFWPIVNHHRHALIKKKIARLASETELAELAALQELTGKYQDIVAPLPAVPDLSTIATE